MTPQFTTPCYIKIDDAQERKEVCEKLKLIGYDLYAINDTPTIYVYKNFAGVYIATTRINKGVKEAIKKGEFIECDSIPLFLDIAGIRSDTDKHQLFIYNEIIKFKCPFNDVTEYIGKELLDGDEMPMEYRKAPPKR